jgi:hypothetical protein
MVGTKVPHKHTGNFHTEYEHNWLPGATSSRSSSDDDDNDNENNINNNTVYTPEPVTNQSSPCKEF